MRPFQSIMKMGVTLMALCGCGNQDTSKPATSSPSRTPGPTSTVDPKTLAGKAELPTPRPVATNGKDGKAAADAAKDLEVPPPVPVKSEDKKSQAKAAGEKSGTAFIADVKLEVIDLAGFDKKIAGMKGKHVVVDGWATWCGPCLQKFPKFVELSKKYEGKNVEFISMSVDQVDEQKKAQNQLSKFGADFHNVLVSSGITEIQNKYAFTGVPIYMIFDPESKLAYKTEKYEDLETALTKMVK